MKRNLCDVLNLRPDDGTNDEEVRQWQTKALSALKNIISVRLTERQKAIIMLYYYEGMKQRDIAKQLGVTESCVSHTKRRALMRLEYDLNLLRS